MSSIHEQVSEQFAEFELRGRGWKVFPFPVLPEPPFLPFRGYIPSAPIDDGRKPTFLSSLLSSVANRLIGTRAAEDLPVNESGSDDVNVFERSGALVELHALLPQQFNVSKELQEALLASLGNLLEPVAFELLGTSDRVIMQIVMAESDSAKVQRQLRAFVPEVNFVKTTAYLESALRSDAEQIVVDFGLDREFFFQIVSGKTDHLSGIAAALGELEEGEFGVCQTIFQRCVHPWADALVDHAIDASGKSVFTNRPEYADAVREKTSRPLYAVVLRFATQAASFGKAWYLLCEMAEHVALLSDARGNGLIPLSNDGYPFDEHLNDVLTRRSRRTGMLLNCEELLALAHFPSALVREPKLLRKAASTKSAPSVLAKAEGLLLGMNSHAGETIEVRLSTEQRARHMHVIGASGTGKSNLLFNSIYQDLQNGEGIAVFDPHGELIDRLLRVIPDSRIDDVILIDPSDQSAAVAFNILSPHDDFERDLLAADLVSIFRRLSNSWGDQLEMVFLNAVLAFLRSKEGGTLRDLRKFLLDDEYRTAFLGSVNDEDVLFFWKKGFRALQGNKSVGPVLIRLQNFLSRPAISNMVGQKNNRLNFSEILDSRAIFLARLSKGMIGDENAFLLGSLLMAKFQQAAMARQRRTAADRRRFWIYLDEFQNFISNSVVEILSGARKYGVGLTLAHHELQQLKRNPDVASAVLTHTETRVVFKVSDEDARVLEKGFSSFTAQDIQNLATGSAIARVEKSDADFNVSIPFRKEIDQSGSEERKGRIISRSRERYSTPLSEIRCSPQNDSSSEPIAKGHPTREEPQAATPATANSETENSSPVDAPEANPNNCDEGLSIQPHQALKERIADFGSGLGYEFQFEAALPSGEKIDVVLIRGLERLAIEIARKNPIEHELRNVEKCMREGYVTILVSEDRQLLTGVQEPAKILFNREDQLRLYFFSPEELLAFLHQRNTEAKKTGPSKRPINLTKKLSAEERAKQEAANLDQLRRNLRKRKPD